MSFSVRISSKIGANQEDFDDNIYTWSDSPLGAVYTLDEYPLSDTEDSDSTTCPDSDSDDEDLVMAVHDPL